jgi:hypothetical protein
MKIKTNCTVWSKLTRRIFWVQLVHDWTIFVKYKRKCYSIDFAKFFGTKQGQGVHLDGTPAGTTGPWRQTRGIAEGPGLSVSAWRWRQRGAATRRSLAHRGNLGALLGIWRLSEAAGPADRTRYYKPGWARPLGSSWPLAAVVTLSPHETPQPLKKRWCFDETV